MSKSNFGTVLAFIAGIVIIVLVADNLAKKKQIEELQKDIDENENLTEEIKAKLSELIQNHQEVAPKIAAEIAQIMALLEVKQNNSAVLKLAKIIENLLKEHYKGNASVKQLAVKVNRKSPSFADYLEQAKADGLLSGDDYHLLLIMKAMRNEEAHELAVNPHRSKVFAAFIAGISFIIGLSKLLKKKTIQVKSSNQI